jgi:proteasome accessory factor A
MSETDNRITGTEMEWSIMVQELEGADFMQLSDEHAERVVNDFLPSNILRVSDMLQNGGRLYVDVGDHVEYATPEDDWLFGTVINEFAGEQIVLGALLQARNAGMFHDFRMYKRVVDDELSTQGYHNSFLSPGNRMKIDAKHLSLAGLHIATGNMFFGSGAVILDRAGQGHYRLAQKVLNLTTDFARTSHGADQPLISLRDEPLTKSDKYKRVHLTSFDPNMSPWATWVRLGSMSIVLRMVEQGYFGTELMPKADLYKLAKHVAADLSLKKLVRLENGKMVRPEQLQEALIERADKMDLPEEEVEVREEWKRAHTDIKKDPRLLIDRADWVAKRAALDRYMKRHNLWLAHHVVRGKDLQWDDRGPDGIGVAMRRSRKGYAPMMPTKRQLSAARNHAPSTTRAHVREREIRGIVAKGDVATAYVDWEDVIWPGVHTLHLKDPHQTWRKPRTPRR